MKFIIRHYWLPGSFEVQAFTFHRLRKLIEAECHDRGWLVDDTWDERVDSKFREVEVEG